MCAARHPPRHGGGGARVTLAATLRLAVNAARALARAPCRSERTGAAPPSPCAGAPSAPRAPTAGAPGVRASAAARGHGRACAIRGRLGGGFACSAASRSWSRLALSSRSLARLSSRVLSGSARPGPPSPSLRRPALRLLVREVERFERGGLGDPGERRRQAPAIAPSLAPAGHAAGALRPRRLRRARPRARAPPRAPRAPPAADAADAADAARRARARAASPSPPQPIGDPRGRPDPHPPPAFPPLCGAPAGPPTQRAAAARARARARRAPVRAGYGPPARARASEIRWPRNVRRAAHAFRHPPARRRFRRMRTPCFGRHRRTHIPTNTCDETADGRTFGVRSGCSHNNNDSVDDYGIRRFARRCTRSVQKRRGAAHRRPSRVRLRSNRGCIVW